MPELVWKENGLVRADSACGVAHTIDEVNIYNELVWKRKGTDSYLRSRMGGGSEAYGTGLASETRARVMFYMDGEVQLGS